MIADGPFDVPAPKLVVASYGTGRITAFARLNSLPFSSRPRKMCGSSHSRSFSDSGTLIQKPECGCECKGECVWAVLTLTLTLTLFLLDSSDPPTAAPLLPPGNPHTDRRSATGSAPPGTPACAPPPPALAPAPDCGSPTPSRTPYRSDARAPASGRTDARIA